MATSRKHANVCLILALLFVSTGCPSFEEGFRRPACIYEDKTVEAYVSKFGLEGDSVTHISFMPTEKYEGMLNLRLRGDELDKFNVFFNQSILKDTSIIYLIEGSFMTQGTCSPHGISSLQRLK